MQTYQNKRKTPDRAAPSAREAVPSRSQMLHLSGAGAPQPMSPQLREKFEPGFQADFTNIRISRGHIPEELGVQAVAQGTDILLDADARSAAYFSIDEGDERGGHVWHVHQVFRDSDDDRDFGIWGDVDLDATQAEGAAVFSAYRVGFVDDE